MSAPTDIVEHLSVERQLTGEISSVGGEDRPKHLVVYSLETSVLPFDPLFRPLARETSHKPRVLSVSSSTKVGAMHGEEAGWHPRWAKRCRGKNFLQF